MCDVLVELSLEPINKVLFDDVLRSKLERFATVNCTQLRATVELQDLDELTKKKEVNTAVSTVAEALRQGSLSLS